jgi:AcrR family transcriptional regulator
MSGESAGAGDVVAVEDKDAGRRGADRRRPRNPQGQGVRLRDDLIAAADRILAQTGSVEALSLRAVAREVGIATPSIYLHFPDKGALVTAVLRARFAELGSAVGAAARQAIGPFPQLRAGCLAYCRFATEYPNAYRVLFGVMRAAASGSVPRESLMPASGYAGAEAFNFLVEGVAACMRAGLAPDDDPFRVATNVWTALHGIVTLRNALPAFPWPPLERQLDDALAGMVGLHHNPPSPEE